MNRQFDRQIKNNYIYIYKFVEKNKPIKKQNENKSDLVKLTTIAVIVYWHIIEFKKTRCFIFTIINY